MPMAFLSTAHRVRHHLSCGRVPPRTLACVRRQLPGFLWCCVSPSVRNRRTVAAPYCLLRWLEPMRLPCKKTLKLLSYLFFSYKYKRPAPRIVFIFLTKLWPAKIRKPAELRKHRFIYVIFWPLYCLFMSFRTLPLKFFQKNISKYLHSSEITANFASLLRNDTFKPQNGMTP